MLHYETTDNEQGTDLIRTNLSEVGLYRKLITTSPIVKDEYKAALFVQFVRIFVTSNYDIQETQTEYARLIQSLDVKILAPVPGPSTSMDTENTPAEDETKNDNQPASLLPHLMGWALSVTVLMPNTNTLILIKPWKDLHY